MSDALSIESTDAWKFVVDLQALCPGEFYGEPRVIQYGIKMAMRNGGALLVWFRQGGFVSKLSCESASPSAAVLAKLEELVRGKLISFNRRPALERAISEWRSQAAIHLTLTATTDPSPVNGQAQQDGPMNTSPECDDPIGEIPASGTIGLRGNAHRLPTRSASGPIAESGWSQEIGRRCEQFAFEWIAARCGGTPSKDSSSIDPVRFRIGASDRLLVWINAEIEQGNSWDIEERDVATGKILRRHEVKARTGELTESEHALAVELGDAYAIWRVDPDTGMCKRLRARGIQQEISPTPVRAIGSDQSHPRRVSAGTHADDPDAPTMVVLGSSTREFCRRLRRTHQCFVGRFRGNLVVAFRVTPELEKELPPSKSRVWVANRSSAGCERLLVHASMAATPSRAPASGGRLIVGIVLSGSRGLGHAMKQAGCSFMG